MKNIKNLVLVIVLVLFLASMSQAQYLVGARASAMGGTGVSTAYDMASAYYNPAGLMRAGVAGFQASFDYKTQGLDKIGTVLSTASDPAKFITDNYSSALDLTGQVKMLFGLNMNKVGLTVFPTLTVAATKTQNSLIANGAASGLYNTVLTLGKTYGIPGLTSIDVGLNAKYIGGTYGTIDTALVGGAISGTKSIRTASGMGFDVGALATFNIPAVTTLNVGLVARDLGESYTANSKNSTLTAPATGSTFTETPLPDTSMTTNVDPSYAIGVSGKIPVVGILLAADIDTGKDNSSTHFGLEYPILMDLIALRAGIASGKNAGVDISYTTFGAKLGIPFLPLNIAMIADNKDSKNNSISFDLGVVI